MGRMIEESRTTTPMSNEEIVEALKTMVFGKQAFEKLNAKERETLDKAWNIIDQYENRLKADLVTMLTDIQLEIKEKSIIDYDEDLYDGGECVISVSEINEIIQQKINALN